MFVKRLVLFSCFLFVVKIEKESFGVYKRKYIFICSNCFVLSGWFTLLNQDGKECAMTLVSIFLINFGILFKQS